jgi:hypothetical protein
MKKRITYVFSILLAICEGCKQELSLNTSQKQSNGHYNINVRAVWGTVTSVGGATDIREQLSTMNVPQFTSNMFSSLEDEIGKWWEDALKEEMGKAGAEERRSAMQLRKIIFVMVFQLSLLYVMVGGQSVHSNTHTMLMLELMLYLELKPKHCFILV